ncbi:oligosaccharide flippase family protein [Bradyrhizobium sp. CIAT3101]|uniref:lipopolysaccharide biosynthesis protein n=1 Tax=Bradyrhizobium sp. CIAT3101 TaxID=439387 RepID=UPI0024B0EA13|nr:oligosaccharide flippase family protein [Bradyrhizobium sp. CIAT3101]WFU84476.1 oligosaccharide flippase family protein [Bradyrhizobium sp. CIAT3101]
MMLTSALRVAGRWKGRALFALVDQGCVSLSNFLFTIVLANHVSLESFGYYSIAWTTSILAETVTGALINDALPAFASTRVRGPRGDFRSAVAWISIGLGGLTSVAVAAAGITILYWSPELGAILLCLAVVNPVQRFQSFVRRLCYIEDRVDIAALSGVSYALTIFGLLACLVLLDRLTPVMAIFVWAAASIPAVILGVAARISPVDVVSRAAIYEVARDVFRSSRWLLGASLISWVGSQGVIPLVATFAGPAAGGALRALFNIVTPVSQINVAINQLTVPRLAEAATRSDGHAMRKRVSAVTAVFVLLASGFSIILVGWPVQVLEFFYRRAEIVAAAPLMWPFAILVVTEAVNQGMAGALLALNRTRAIMFVRAAGLIAFLGSALILQRESGLTGVVWGLVVASVVTAMISGQEVLRATR